MYKNKYRTMFIVVIMIISFTLLLAGCSSDQTSSVVEESYSASGTVKDNEGNGIEKVLLNFSNYGIAETNNEGQWQKVGLTGTVTINLAKEGYSFTPDNIEVSKQSKQKDGIDVTANKTDKKDYKLNINIKGNGSITKSPDAATYKYGDEVQLSAAADSNWSFDQWNGDLSGSDNPATITIDGNKSVTAIFAAIVYSLETKTEGEGTISEIKISANEIELTAIPNTGWTFDHWEGDLSGNINPETITLDGFKTVTAVFVSKEYSLSINTEGNGSITKSPDAAAYKYGDEVQLSAAADSNWSFDQWNGDLSGSDNPATITIDGNKSVTAIFAAIVYSLETKIEGEGTINQIKISANEIALTAIPNTGWTFDHWEGDLSGNINPETITLDGFKTVTAVFVSKEYSLSINTEGNGSITKSPDAAAYKYGDEVQLSAAADSNWSFDQWNGDLSGSDNPATITIDGNKSVTAIFAAIVYSLETKIEGEGTINQIKISANEIALTAIPNTGWTFDHWEGDLSGNINPETITLDGFKTVTAVFVSKEYSLSINTEGNGSITKSPDAAAYKYGDEVQLSAAADSNWSFDQWNGDLSGSNNPATITIDGNKSVTAIFAAIVYSLETKIEGEGTINQIKISANEIALTASPNTGWMFDHWEGDLSGNINPETITLDGFKTVTAVFVSKEYSLSINTEGNGSITKSPDAAAYKYGDEVQLSAAADSNWSFDQWNGDLSGSDNPATITIDGNKSVTAIFAAIVYSLETKIEGEGTISEIKISANEIALTAIPNTGWTFDHWEGDLSGNINPETITLDAFKTVTAVFVSNEYSLSINTEGNGSITKSPDAAAYKYGDEVQLSAAADSNWSFDQWNGDLSGSDNPATITIDGNKSVTAIFAAIVYSLETKIEGEGTINQIKISANEIALTAIPNTGWTFDHWEGDLSGNINPETITLDGFKTVTAVFVSNEYSLSINNEGNGSITKSPDAAAYKYGDEVQLSAAADSNWSFDQWNGDLSGSDNPATITIDGNKSVTAVFSELSSEENVFTLNVGESGSVIVTEPNGTKVTVRENENYSFSTQQPATLSLSASAQDERYKFENWSGDSTSINSSIDITVDKNMAVNANFKGNVFKIINSWGESWGPNGDGSLYMTYDAAKQANLQAWVIGKRSNYQVEAHALFEVEASNRNQWKFNIKSSNSQKSLYPPGQKLKGGSYPFPSNRIALDITELLPFDNESIVLEVINNSYSSGTVKSFTVEVNGQEFNSNTSGLIVGANSTKTITINNVSASLSGFVQSSDDLLESAAREIRSSDIEAYLNSNDSVQNDNNIVNGHGTGWKNLTREEWQKAKDNGSIKVLDTQSVLGRLQKVSSSGRAIQRVDYSQSEYFPPVRSQGSEGSCSAWSIGYYIKSYYEAEDHGWDLRSGDNSKIMSPDFLYHLVNGGTDGGSYITDNLRVLDNIGISTWATMPYDDRDHTTWPSESAFREAGNYRSNIYSGSTGYYILINDDSDIEAIQSILANGYLVTIAVDSTKYYYLTENGVWTKDNYINLREDHANTIVGYYE